MKENNLSQVQRSKLIKIYENSEFLIVSKPGGIEFHTDEGVLQILREQFAGELYGVHRLDKNTSGLMMFAKSKAVQSELSILFMQNKVSKYYFALSASKPKKKMGTIEGELFKGRGGSYYLKEKSENSSKTIFISGLNQERHQRCFILRPLTGKTHQLRVVMKSVGAPIIGDERYHGLAAQQMSLHAFYLQFPFRGEEFVFTTLENCSQLMKNDSIKNTFKHLWNSDIGISVFKDDKRKLDCEI